MSSERSAYVNADILKKQLEDNSLKLLFDCKARDAALEAGTLSDKWKRH